MVDFAGWEMPVQYTSIVEEHIATRTQATLFDVSHMGRFRFDGPASEKFLDGLCTRRVAGIAPGTVRYSLITNQEGGILDDVLAYHLVDVDGRPFHWMVVNAGNREKIRHWIDQHLPRNENVRFNDVTVDTSMIAVQGPTACGMIQQVFPSDDVDQLLYYRATVCPFEDGEAIVSRTGYTGEDGFEIIVPSQLAETVWSRLTDSGARAAGLGARDTLRLEAGMPLYGHELSEQIDPFRAGLSFAVNAKDRSFPGRDALVRARDDTSRPKLIGLKLKGRRVAREHYQVLFEGQRIGEVTSGTFSPTLQMPIAMAYVGPEYAESGGTVSIDVRGQPVSAEVTELPFYKRS